MNVPIPSIPGRWLTAGIVIAALAVLGAFVAEDWSTLGAWLGQHATWTAQVALVAVAAAVVVLGVMALRSTILDPFTILPEWTKRWLAWLHRTEGQSLTAHDPFYMVAGAIVIAGTSIMIGLIVAAVFGMAS